MPTLNEQGLAARLSPHFGSAPYHTIVASDTGDVSALVNEHARHEHGRCDPAKGLEGRGIDAVVCRGLGLRALRALNAAGMDVLVTDEWTVAGALEAFRRGALTPMSADLTCEGGRHGAGQGRGLAVR